jgi:hypothetical protein
MIMTYLIFAAFVCVLCFWGILVFAIRKYYDVDKVSLDSVVGAGW